jgi:integrase
MGDLDSEHVQSLLNRLGKRISPKSVKNVWTTLRVMWNSAVAWKYVSGELRVTLPQSRKFRMRCYTVEEVKRILAGTRGADRMFFWLAAETGLRVGELTALRVGDVDFAHLYIEVSKAIWHGDGRWSENHSGFPERLHFLPAGCLPGGIPGGSCGRLSVPDERW